MKGIIFALAVLCCACAAEARDHDIFGVTAVAIETSIEPVTVEPAEPVDPSYYTLTAPLDQDGFAIDEPVAAAEDVWITEAYWTTECVGGVCRPVQRFRRVARNAASTALEAVTLDGVVLQQRPARRFVGRVFAARPLRTWWANRPRLFGRCR